LPCPGQRSDKDDDSTSHSSDDNPDLKQNFEDNIATEIIIKKLVTNENSFY
jgi:hypothetical protein